MSNNNPKVTIGLFLHPLDVLFFRGGRPFSASTRAESGLPTPQVMAGALTTWLLEQHGCDANGFSRLRKAVQEGKSFAEAAEAAWIADVQIRGPWLAQYNPQASKNLVPLDDLYTPMPANLRQRKSAKSDDLKDNELLRVSPLAENSTLPGWHSTKDKLRPLWTKEPARLETASGFLNATGLQKYLHNQPLNKKDHLVSSDTLYEFEDRVGTEINPDRLSVEESKIYTARFLALRKQIGFYVEVDLPPGCPCDVFPEGKRHIWPLGGEARRVEVTRVEPFHWPEPDLKSESPGPVKTLLLLTTPALFDPDHPWRFTETSSNGTLVAAAVSGSLPVSGWDLARGGPKPTRFAVAAGSVYFLEHTSSLDIPSPLSPRPADQRAGWGCFLKGTWNDA